MIFISFLEAARKYDFEKSPYFTGTLAASLRARDVRVREYIVIIVCICLLLPASCFLGYFKIHYSDYCLIRCQIKVSNKIVRVLYLKHRLIDRQ